MVFVVEPYEYLLGMLIVSVTKTTAVFYLVTVLFVLCVFGFPFNRVLGVHFSAWNVADSAFCEALISHGH